MSAGVHRMAEKSTLNIHLELLGPWLLDATITEIVINEPFRVLVEHQGGRWVTHDVPAATFAWCMDLAQLVQNYSNQTISESNPLMGAQLPGGERVQIVIPPVVRHISITIRRPSTRILSMADLAVGGTFTEVRGLQSLLLAGDERSHLESLLGARDKELLSLFRARDWPGFFDAAVQGRKNIVSSGATGAGKTTLSIALAALIDPSERIITIEDVWEMRLVGHNVGMVYPRNGNGVAKVTARLLLEAALRMRPDRILLAELRGDEAFFFFQNVLNSGHPGTITSIHATGAKLAFHRLSLMIKGSVEGGGIDLADIMKTLYALVDVVAQMERLPDGRRVVSEVFFDPVFAVKQLG